MIRIGHMGYIFPMDALTITGVLEACLSRLGCPVTLGDGTAACIQALR